jgi:hypothetical protein
VTQETTEIKYLLQQLERGSFDEGVIATLFRESFRVSEVVEETNQIITNMARTIEAIEEDIRASQ